MSYRYCGREFEWQEIETIRKLIAENPPKHRYALSFAVCEALGWRKPDGNLKAMSCRVAMIRMHNDGLIKLPPPRCGNGNGKKYNRRTLLAQPGAPVTVPVGALGDLHLELIGNPKESHLWNEYIDRYHYLGYKPLPGAQLRYFIKTDHQIIALLGFGAAAWKTAPRDHFIGWSIQQRTRNLHLVINNARFLILPWVQCRNLATKVLSMAAGRLPNDWKKRYHYQPVLVETFVEVQRFLGTSYKAANWIYLGQTQGRGKLDTQHKAKEPIKAVWVYPLKRNFQKQLCC